VRTCDSAAGLGGRNFPLLFGTLVPAKQDPPSSFRIVTCVAQCIARHQQRDINASGAHPDVSASRLRPLPPAAAGCSGWLEEWPGCGAGVCRGPAAAGAPRAAAAAGSLEEACACLASAACAAAFTASGDAKAPPLCSSIPAASACCTVDLRRRTRHIQQYPAHAKSDTNGGATILLGAVRRD